MFYQPPHSKSSNGLSWETKIQSQLVQSAINIVVVLYWLELYLVYVQGKDMHYTLLEVTR